MQYFYILLLRIVAYLEGPIKYVSFLCVLSLLLFSIFKRIDTTRVNKISKPIFVFFIFSIIILLHSFIFGNISMRDIAVFISYSIWLIFTFVYFKNKTINECLNFILITFLIFNITNYLFYTIFYNDQIIRTNSIMSFFGIKGNRIFFPLASGANIYASQLALNTLVVLYFLKNTKKTIYVIIYVFYILMLVLADSRLLLLFALLFSFIYWFSLTTVLILLKKFWLLIGLFLFCSLYIFYETDIFNAYKRAGELNGTALSRIKIWSLAKDIIIKDFNIFFGNGLNGFENNLLKNHQKVFKDQHLQTSHNFLIQNIIDFGLFGLLIILSLIFEMLRFIKRINSIIITYLTVMILLIGITESIPTFYSFEPTFFFITIISIILTNDKRKNTRFYEGNKLLS